MDDPDKQDYDAKDRAFYSVMLGAWFNTKFEYDKQMLGLSATAIGLLVTLLRFSTGALSVLQLRLFASAFFFFLITIIEIFCILAKNAENIQREINKEIRTEEEIRESETKSLTLKRLDRLVVISFTVGIVLVIGIGIDSMQINLNKEGLNMSQKEPRSIQGQFASDTNSLYGMEKLRPKRSKASQSSLSAIPVQPTPLRDEASVMQLTELLPALRQLSRDEKLQVIQILTAELAQ